ncbi:septum formation initiator family protein [Solwaraspora sp. WMMD406]|uniref:septum formation initiator family protein n=1 Tax=Solwaraspora sp. WMMD406 TaxID=3016095 RepID=UPI0024173D9D|nr:septum formation initiator family protein [Solwaraspora sp. WMMD406]MDG4763828.1 septum formation initiator family protein [Solwaraspora sp. WMMD406]
MTQRRTPSGQGPARRPSHPGRSGARGPLRSAGRDAVGRGEQRGAPIPLDRTAGDRPTAGRAATGRTAGRGGAGRRAGGRTADPGRPSARPAAARRTAPGPVKRTSAPQPNRFTGRATVLLVVLVALALAYTYPVRVYLSQQSDIARMEQAQQAQRERIEDLSAQAERWEDPDFIRIEAKRRFYMVYPGEVPLLVLHDPQGAARDAGGQLPAGPGDQTAPADPWYDTLWSSVRAADAEGTAP